MGPELTGGLYANPAAARKSPAAGAVCSLRGVGEARQRRATELRKRKRRGALQAIV